MTKPIAVRITVSAEHLAHLLRFAETCEDGEGYDVPKAAMKELAAVGLVRRTSGSIYTTTQFGDEALRCAELDAAHNRTTGFEP